MNIETIVYRSLFMSILTSLLVYNRIPSIKKLIFTSISIILYYMFIYNTFPGDKRYKYM